MLLFQKTVKVLGCSFFIFLMLFTGCKNNDRITIQKSSSRDDFVILINDEELGIFSFYENGELGSFRIQDKTGKTVTVSFFQDNCVSYQISNNANYKVTTNVIPDANFILSREEIIEQIKKVYKLNTDGEYIPLE